MNPQLFANGMSISTGRPRMCPFEHLFFNDFWVSWYVSLLNKTCSEVQHRVWQIISSFDKKEFRVSKKIFHSKWANNQHEIISRKIQLDIQHFRFIYLLMCWARSDMVQCLQIRPVNLKQTSTQQLLINVFVWHSFPMKKFLKLIASVILENARIFNSKNVKFIFSNFLFDFRVRFSTFSTFFRFFELAFFDFSFRLFGYDHR